jgi:hypothetical protein
VSELIDPLTGECDVQLVKYIFLGRGCSTYLAIPTRPDHDDVVARHFDSKGKFTVKFAYSVRLAEL